METAMGRGDIMANVGGFCVMMQVSPGFAWQLGNAEEYSAKHTRKMKKAYMVFRHKSIVVALGCPKKIRMGDFACRGGRMKM